MCGTIPLLLRARFLTSPVGRTSDQDWDPTPCRGLTMVTFKEQLGTEWKEDIGEVRSLSDHVHCSQNSLWVSGSLRWSWGVDGLSSSAWQICGGEGQMGVVSAASPSSAHRGWAAGAASPPLGPGPGTSRQNPWRSKCTGLALALAGSPGSGHCTVGSGVWSAGSPCGGSGDREVPVSTPQGFPPASLLDAVGNEEVGILSLIQQKHGPQVAHSLVCESGGGDQLQAFHLQGKGRGPGKAQAETKGTCPPGSTCLMPG